MASGVGKANGASRRGAFDNWFRYPAGFSPETRDLLVRRMHLEPGMTLVDPFAGVAVCGVALARLGMNFRGIEAHPLIAELANLKFQRPGEGASLLRAAERVAAAAPRQDTWSEHELVRRCFAPSTLGVLTALRDAIQRSDSRWHTHLKWALLGTLRDCARAGVGWPYQRPDMWRTPRRRKARDGFFARVAAMAADIDEWTPSTAQNRVVADDSRAARAWHRALGRTQADGVISSPPYLNNYDYADATRLELYFWRVATSWSGMIHEVREGMITASTQQTTQNAATKALSHLETYESSHVAIADLSRELKAERKKRARGKEYDALVVMYFADLSRVLVSMLGYVKPAARVGLVVGDSAPYGVFVDTPALIASIAQELGFRRIRIETIRQRGLRWRENGSRHQVALSERLVLLETPS